MIVLTRSIDCWVNTTKIKRNWKRQTNGLKRVLIKENNVTLKLSQTLHLKRKNVWNLSNVFIFHYFYVIFCNYLVSVLKEQLDCSQGLLKELQKYEKEQEITFNMYNQKKSQTKQFKKKLLNEQQRQVIFTLLKFIELPMWL